MPGIISKADMCYFISSLSPFLRREQRLLERLSNIPRAVDCGWWPSKDLNLNVHES